MTCSRCDSDRILSFSAKCSDMFGMQIGGKDYDGYVPDGIEPLGHGDYVSGKLCLDCGQLQSDDPFPLDKLPIELGWKKNRYGDYVEPDPDEEPEPEVDWEAYHNRNKRR